MWFALLPSAAIIAASMSIPHIYVYFSHLIFLGNPYKRYLSNKYECHTYLRDMRLGNGDPYKQLGLECLFPEKDKGGKDMEEEDKKCECP